MLANHEKLHFQCNSGKHDNAVFHGWQAQDDFIFYGCNNHFHGNAGNFHNVNNLQSSAGKFDSLCNFQCSSGLINNYDLFQSGSGKIDSLSLWGASTFLALQSICSACDMSFFGMTGSDLQCQASELYWTVQRREFQWSSGYAKLQELFTRNFDHGRG